MRWKFSFPGASSTSGERTALEDLYLLPEDGSSGGRSYWVTVEGLQSFTGGTREEKLARLAGREFDITDTMDMLVHQEDFDKSELLQWARVFIQNRFGDPHPELVEAEGDEVARCTPVIRENDPKEHRGHTPHLLFVHHQSGPPLAFPEEVLQGDPGLTIGTLCLEDIAAGELSLDRLLQADLVFVMEKRTRAVLQRRFKAMDVNRRIICLFLPEHHDRQDPAFLTLFKERVRVYLDRLGWGRTDRE